MKEQLMYLEEKKPVKKWLKNHIVLLWAIASVGFAIVIQLCFSIPAPFPWLDAAWSAGDVLTYASTVALGLLAVWQNQKFKEENDKAQERLESIGLTANELSVIAKIAEIEQSYVDHLDEAQKTFFDVCRSDEVERILKSADGCNLLDVSPRIQQIRGALPMLEMAYGSGYQSKIYSSDSLRKETKQYAEKMLRILEKYRDAKGDRRCLQEEIRELPELHKTFVELKRDSEGYLAHRRVILYAILFEDASLADIRQVYEIASSQK